MSPLIASGIRCVFLPSALIYFAKSSLILSNLYRIKPNPSSHYIASANLMKLFLSHKPTLGREGFAALLFMAGIYSARTIHDLSAGRVVTSWRMRSARVDVPFVMWSVA